MPSASSQDASPSAAPSNLRPSPSRPGEFIWEAPDGSLRLEGSAPMLQALAERLRRGERILVSCTGRGVAPLRRKFGRPEDAWRRDADFRVVRWLTAPREDVLVLRDEIKDWACKPSVTVLDEHDEPQFNFTPGWAPDPEQERRHGR